MFGNSDGQCRLFSLWKTSRPLGGGPHGVKDLNLAVFDSLREVASCCKIFINNRERQDLYSVSCFTFLLPRDTYLRLQWFKEKSDCFWWNFNSSGILKKLNLFHCGLIFYNFIQSKSWINLPDCVTTQGGATVSSHSACMFWVNHTNTVKGHMHLRQCFFCLPETVRAMNPNNTMTALACVLRLLQIAWFCIGLPWTHHEAPDMACFIVITDFLFLSHQIKGLSGTLTSQNNMSKSARCRETLDLSGCKRLADSD